MCGIKSIVQNHTFFCHNSYCIVFFSKSQIYDYCRAFRINFLFLLCLIKYSDFGPVCVSDGNSIANSDNVIPVASNTRDNVYILSHLVCPFLVKRLLLLKTVGSKPAERANPEQDTLNSAARLEIPLHNSLCVMTIPFVIKTRFTISLLDNIVNQFNYK